MTSYGELYLRDQRPLSHRPNAAVPAHGIMVINASANTDILGNAPVLPTKQCPTAGAPGMTVVINGPEDCPASKIGRCLDTPWPVVALYDTNDGTPAVGEVWGPGANTWLLKKGLPGFIVRQAGVVGPAGYGQVLVQAVPVTHLFGVLDGDLTSGNTATMSIYRGTPLSDTNTNVTITAWLAGNTTVEEGQRVVVVPESGSWQLIDAQCPPEA